MVSFAVVFDPDTVGRIAEVDEQIRAQRPRHRDLRPRSRESGVDDHGAGPALTRQHRAAVAQREHLSQLPGVALARAGLRPRREHARVNAGAQELIERGDRLEAGQPSGAVERRALSRRHPGAVEPDHIVARAVGDVTPAALPARRRSTGRNEHLDGPVARRHAGSRRLSTTARARRSRNSASGGDASMMSCPRPACVRFMASSVGGVGAARRVEPRSVDSARRAPD